MQSPKFLPNKLKHLIKGEGKEGIVMKKRMLPLLLAIVLGMCSFAGCGNKTSGSGEDKTNTNDANKTEDTQAPDSNDSGNGGDGKAVTLNFPSIWVGTDSKAEVFGQMIKGFNEEYAGKYEVKIEEQTDYDAYRDKIRTLISTGDAPDIFTVDSMADLTLFSQSGKLMDITAYVEENLADRFVESVVDGAKVDGINYAIPYEMAVVPIMYNKKLLEEAGIKDIPTSYDELWTACEALKENGIFPITQMTNDNAWTSMLWYSYAVAACGGPDVYEKGLDDPAFVKAAELLQKMFEYTSSDAVGADASVVNGHYFNERAAIYTNGSWILGRIKSEGVEGLIDNTVMGPGLSQDGKNGGAYINSVLAYIAVAKQDDPNKQAAVEAFLDYITDPDRVLELANSSGALFAIDMDASKITDPQQIAIVEQSKAAPFMLPYFQAAVPTAMANAFPSTLEAMVLGDITPQEFVDALKEFEE